jgi:N-acetylneuraminic acid mutarotase
MNFKRKFLFIIPFLFSISLFAQGPWTQEASFGGTARHRPFTFSVGQRGYLGCGWNGTIMYQDMWEYDPGSNTWSQKANYPSGPRLSAFGFSIGNKGYAGCGLDQFLNGQPDFYEYNPATNTWTAKANFIGTPIFGATATVVGNKGYVVCGDDWNPNYWRHNEMYAYDPGSNSWSYASTFPQDGRRDPVGFTINGKIYVGTGSDNSYVECNDWWEYNPTTSAWTQKAMFAGSGRSQAVAFAVSGKGYVGTGGVADVNDFWQYDATANSWQQIDDFPGAGRENSQSFVIGNKAYMACGTSGTNYNDCWEFNPQNITGVNENSQSENPFGVFPNPVETKADLILPSSNANQENQFSLYSEDGKLIHSEKFTGEKMEFNRDGLANGVYVYSVTAEGKKIAEGKIIVK